MIKLRKFKSNNCHC